VDATKNIGAHPLMPQTGGRIDTVLSSANPLVGNGTADTAAEGSRMAEETLSSSSDRLSLLEAAPDAMVVVDRNGEVGE